MNRRKKLYKLTSIGDSALLLVLSDEISLKINNQIRALDHQLQSHRLEGILEWVPGYTSLLVFYDPKVLDLSAAKAHVISCLKETGQKTAPHAEQISISVRYGGEAGPDLTALANAHGISPSEVVRLHSEPTYQVGMMGFTPGFAYLLGLNPDLATPRRESPRTHVPAGSVGIAGSQTGVYPLESPGGWQIIGKTERVFYDPEGDRPFLLSPGDEVRFVPLVGGVMP